jgi:mgtE-like transporter
MEHFNRIMRESVPILFLLLLGELIAGLILANGELQLEQVPGLLLLVPAILSLRGNISSALGSRFGSYMHMGLVESELKVSTFKKPIVKENFYASMALNLIMSFALGVFAYFIAILVGITTASIFVLTFIAVVAGFISGFFLVFLTIFLAIFTSSKGMDPDNVLTPTVATIGDIFTVLFLFLVADLALVLF